MSELFQAGLPTDIEGQNQVIIDHLIKLAEQVREVKNELHRRAEGTEKQIVALRHAFPGDDPVGHRAYHDELIAAEKARKEFWQKLFFELAKWGVLGFAGWLLVAGWSAFLKGPK